MDQQIATAEQETPGQPPPVPDPRPLERRAVPDATAEAPPARSYVYALGQIEPRFPSLAVEKEFMQLIGMRSDTAGMSDRSLLIEALSEPANRYLARSMCWCFLVQGLETYILVPRDPGDFQLLIGAVREDPRRDDVDIVIGTLAGIAPPEMCNGLAVPAVVVDMVYSFDRESLIASIPVPDSVAAVDSTSFRTTAGTFFDDVMRLADNAGATDEHRALNYLAVRYPAIYTKLAELQEQNSSLAGVRVRPAALSGPRDIVDVIFSFVHRQTGVTTKFYLQVDVTEEWPFLVRPLSPYFDTP